ncbi:MAG: class I SAM-dependent methyltransferase [Candidatus Caldarchaeum sp.]
MAHLNYDVLNTGYDELYGEEQRVKYRRAFEQAPKNFSRIVDVGCGTGLLREFLREQHVDAEYVGVDVSSGMLNKAREKIDSSTHLVQADAHRLPFRDQVFSHVFSFTVVHHLEPKRFLEEALRICSGVVVVSQHKRLNPRITGIPVADDETVDEIFVQPVSSVFRKASGIGC